MPKMALNMLVRCNYFRFILPILRSSLVFIDIMLSNCMLILSTLVLYFPFCQVWYHLSKTHCSWLLQIYKVFLKYLFQYPLLSLVLHQGFNCHAYNFFFFLSLYISVYFLASDAFPCSLLILVCILFVFITSTIIYVCFIFVFQAHWLFNLLFFHLAYIGSFQILHCYIQQINVAGAILEKQIN